MTSRFDRDTAVEPIGEGVFRARIDPGWWIVTGPNGGYVAAIVLRATADALDDALADSERVPITFTVHFTAAPAEGEARVTTRVERIGRSVATVTARLEQGDRLLAVGTAAFSAPRPSPITFADRRPPPAEPPEACEPFPEPGTSLIPLNDRYETRWAGGARPFTRSDRSESLGWLRTEDGREVDHLLVSALADAWVPPVFSRLEEPGQFAVPTVELTTHFRGGVPLPAGTFVLGRYETATAAGGYVEEEGELWSPDGVLIAQFRQLAAIVPAPG